MVSKSLKSIVMCVALTGATQASELTSPDEVSGGWEPELGEALTDSARDRLCQSVRSGSVPEFAAALAQAQKISHEIGDTSVSDWMYGSRCSDGNVSYNLMEYMLHPDSAEFSGDGFAGPARVLVKRMAGYVDKPGPSGLTLEEIAGLGFYTAVEKEDQLAIQAYFQLMFWLGSL